jgi:hypothetical protein
LRKKEGRFASELQRVQGTVAAREQGHSPQITAPYREPEGTEQLPSGNVSSIRALLVLAIGASRGVQRDRGHSTHQFLLRTHNLRANATDMGRRVLMSAHRMCIDTTAHLAQTLQTTAENALQSQEQFDITSALQLYLQLSSSRGRGSGLCMLISIVMPTVRSPQTAQGVAGSLLFLSVEGLKLHLI